MGEIGVGEGSVPGCDGEGTSMSGAAGGLSLGASLGCPGCEGWGGGDGWPGSEGWPG
jgi:hypothetical protein